MTLPLYDFGEDSTQKGQGSSSTSLPLYDAEPSTQLQITTPPEKPGFFKSTFNLAKNMAAMVGLGTPTDVTAAQKTIQENLAMSPQNAEAGTRIIEDLTHMFSKVTWAKTKAALTGAKDEVLADPVKAVTDLPMGILSMVANPVNVLAGGDATQNQLEAESVEQKASEVKSLLGTTVGMVVGAGLSKALGKFAFARLASSYGMDSKVAEAALSGDVAPALATGDTRALLLGGPSTLGKLGTKLAGGTAEAGLFGATQSAIANANQDDVAAQMFLQGVAFAPLGAAFEMLHSLNDPKEALLADKAKEIAYTRQAQASLDRSMNQIINTTEGVVTSDNILSGIIEGNLKTNPKAIHVLRNVDPTRIPELEKNPDYVVSTHVREDGTHDVMVLSRKNEFFGDRTIPQNRTGKIVDRTRDEHGNLIPQVGDPVVRTLDDGSIVRGTVVTFEGSGGKDNIIKLDETGQPVQSSSSMKELWVKLDDPKSVSLEPELGAKSHTFTDPNAPIGERLNRQQKLAGHQKLDPETWFVDPEQVTRNIDWGKIHKVNAATQSERALAAATFKVTGELPKVATVTQARELVGYNGQDFFVRSMNPDGTVTLESPYKNGRGGITVQADEIRLRDAAVAQIEPKEFYDNVFKEFPLDGKKPFVQVAGELATRFGVKADGVHTFMREMADRFNESLGHDSPIAKEAAENLMEHNTAIMSEVTAQHQKLVRMANSNGMYIEDLGHSYQLRNTETNEVLPFKGVTPQEGIDFINKSGQASGTDFDATSVVPTGGGVQHPGVLDPSTAKSIEEVVGASRNGNLDRVRAWIQQKNIAHPWYASMRDFIESTSEIHGVNLLAPYTRVQDAYLKFEANTNALYRKYEPLFREIHTLVRDPDRMITLARARETMSADEIAQKLFKARPLNQGELSAGKFIADNNIDEIKVLKYRTELNQIKAQIIAEQKLKLAGADEILKQAPNAEVAQQISNSIKSARSDVARKYQPLFDGLEKKYNMSKLEMQLYDKFQGIASADMNEVSIYGAVRYGQALKDPFNAGLSRADYFTKHNITPREQALIAKIDKAYDELGDHFNIPDIRRINGYMNHMRRLGSEARPEDIARFSAHLDNPGVAEFMSNLSRTGEVVDFNHDMIEALRGYIRGGVKARDLFPAIHGSEISGNRSVGGAKHAFEAEINKLPQNTQDVAYRRIREYLESVTGRQPIPDAVMREGVARTLEKLGIADTSKPIETGSKTASLLSMVNAAYTGGKVYQGLRDLTDVASKYYIKFGGERAREFLKIGVTDANISELIDKGVIRGVDKNTFTQPAESSVFGKVGGAKSKFEDVLFKMTLQDKVFARAQAAAYYEGKSLARQVFNDLMDKKITADQAVSKLSLRQFSDNVTSETLRLAQSHGAEAAADFYGKQTARSTVGLFGLGEQPSGANTKAGRIIGQYGMYPIDTRRFVVDVTTRGTPKEIAGAMARYVASQGALLATGRALGFDMGRWIMTPASLLFTGGPLTQFASAVGTAVGALPTDNNRQKMAYNNFKQYFPSLSDPRSMFLPGSYAAYDYLHGFQLLANHGDARGLGAFLGIPVSDDPNYIQTGSLSAPYEVDQMLKDIERKNQSTPKF